MADNGEHSGSSQIWKTLCGAFALLNLLAITYGASLIFGHNILRVLVCFLFAVAATAITITSYSVHKSNEVPYTFLRKIWFIVVVLSLSFSWIAWRKLWGDIPKGETMASLGLAWFFQGKETEDTIISGGISLFLTLSAIAVSYISPKS